MSVSADNVLARLVEADKRARELVDNAEEELELTVSNMEHEIDEFKESYAEKAKHRIGIVRDTESRASEEASDTIVNRYDTLMHNLETVYVEKHTAWEDELFTRCIGR